MMLVVTKQRNGGKMAKSEPKTKATDVDPVAYVAAIDHPGRRADGETMLALYRELTGMQPVMWGPSMIGYGQYHYETKSCAGDWPRAGFSPRKANLVVYLTCGYNDPAMEVRMAALRDQLGKHKVGASCLYINKLDDVDVGVLRAMIATDLEWMDATYPR
jgi:Domain of unknown function (DU1801)